MSIRALYFDFGFVIGCPDSRIDRKYLYLDWTGIGRIAQDACLKNRLKRDISVDDLARFFEAEVYTPFVNNEKTTLIDPGSNGILLARLSRIFDGVIEQPLVDRVLGHIDTMKYISIADNAKAILEQLHERYRLSMISNMMLPGKLLIDKLAAHGIARYFETISVSSDVGYIKPHPLIFLKTLEKDDLRPDDVLFVGDTYAQDIVGAKRVGMRAAWLNCRHESPLDRELEPDLVISSLDELPAALETLA